MVIFKLMLVVPYRRAVWPLLSGDLVEPVAHDDVIIVVSFVVVFAALSGRLIITSGQRWNATADEEFRTGHC